ncbi:YpdA family putative bacillithiol disulfide reductase [Thermoactinomyces mirandus]|uniref:YpdA family putative bacillithiol disulfide reductase n=1 Tax=Thermoactinomyces mirandus TaxID=2756294 RepID=A0A7W2ATG1_9BACL|nr:YpdA family putative bacillithiol disulfide reductase [Thermoactinomyces mirandus]MBA4603710.1 YpdA family putative bacillithiol disulfide reductase [Thermoactinomyces mirandus]
MSDVVIVGAGPCGISVAIELQREGFEPFIIEKGCLVNSVYHFPLNMIFFSSTDKLEIGGIPFTSVNEKPTRNEALAYFRAVVKHYQLNIHTYEKVVEIAKDDAGFLVKTEKRGNHFQYPAKAVILATGYYDNPHFMQVPGEKLPHVHHYFYDSHPHANQETVVIGGGNSAIDVALDLYRTGAKVTMVYRKQAFDQSVKPWIRPLIESAIEKKRIDMYWESEVVEILPDGVVIKPKDGEKMILPADTVFAMTGYRPDVTFVEQLGGEISSDTGAPVCSEAMETTVPGLYLAGVIAAGHDSSKIFIENGRYHGRLIAKDLKKKNKLEIR